MFKAIALVLSARALLLLAIIGTFALAVYAMREQNVPSLLVLLAFACGTILPTMILEMRRRGD
jgi:hypothetical protein